MSSRFYLILFIVLIVANVSVYKTIFAPRVLTASVLEVGPPAGGGRATLVKTPDNKTILIDTGSDASILRALGENLPMWQRKIDIVILTSSAARFAGGLSAIESRYRILKIIRIGDKNIPYGSSFDLDNSGIKIIAPATLTISYGTSVFKISSSTPAGIYTSDGNTVTKQ